MTAYTASNGTIVADLTALRAIPSTDLPASGFVVLLVASENSWFEYNPTLTSGDATPINNPTTGRWLRIGRDKLTANRTYFVRTDGSDANTGLVNNSGGAFLTWAYAISILATLDGNGFFATIKGSGTFSSTNNCIIDKTFTGLSKIVIEGDVSTPSNCTINAPPSNFDVAIGVNTATPIEIKGIKFTSSATSTPCVLLAIFRGVASIVGYCEFTNAGTGNHIYVTGNQSQLKILSNYMINGGGAVHLSVFDQGLIESIVSGGFANTISGSPSFGASFATAQRAGSMTLLNITYSGSSTGTQYSVGALAGIWALGTTVFAGSIAGTADSKGFYGS